MAKGIENDIDALVKDGILTAPTADAIRGWYAVKNATNPNRLILVFGVLGVLLVGSGIILLVAHNWDDLSIPFKTIFAFLPLLIGQVWAGFTLLKNKDSEMHREMSAVWIAISIGTCISLIAQIYHIHGNLPKFILTWLLLGLPVVYLMRSSVSSLLYIAGATWYGMEAGFGYGNHGNQWAYWLLIAGIIPFYYLLVSKKPAGWFTVLHHYAVPVSVLFCLATLAKGKGEQWMWVAYMSLLGTFYCIGYFLSNWNVTGISNGYRIIGWAGSLLLLFMASFHDFWSTFTYDYKRESFFVHSTPLWLAMGLTVVGLLLLINLYRKGLRTYPDPVLPAFLLYAICFFITKWTGDFPSIFINIYLLITGVLLLVRGQQQERLALLNLGLGVIAVLATCRFFDTDLSFIVRGLMFILVGAGFVYFNYQLIQKKKTT
jgi:uncharacterized membrane protein